MNQQLAITYLLGSVTYGGLLFLLTSGFCLIFGIMRVPNLAHGSLFMLGAYVGVAALRSGAPFAVALLAAGGAAAALGAIFEAAVLRRVAGDEMRQVLATIGLAFVVGDGILAVWGGNPYRAQAPLALRKSLQLFGAVFPAYRVAVLAIAVVSAALLWLLIERTRMGARLRAGVDDLEMTRALGVSAPALFTSAFALGSFLAGVAGALAAPIVSAYPGLDFDILPLALVVVILGGMGSLAGAFVASFVVGGLYIVGPVLLPELSYVILFLPMAITMALRPQGILGRSAR
ncbi:branched-chain amino acid ABC transporter permease [Roseiarcus sp.]|uniref:branched-chain amino acid ABC transporter permease n=1 Tax=Roseiarcus sp. TaxID=1969460 RepID=UPI002C3AE26D|nr:branched-chain amino acid ABC transporter permease [Roseiarcus sp.]